MTRLPTPHIPADTPIELPVTPLGIMAAELKTVQHENMVRQPRTVDSKTNQMRINNLLSQALILVDVERGDGQ